MKPQKKPQASQNQPVWSSSGIFKAMVRQMPEMANWCGTKRKVGPLVRVGQ
jgi:hypothetical protein